jgi:hypothetical protein
MNFNPTVSSSVIQTVKTEPNQHTIHHFESHINEEITRLKKIHGEQIFKLCNELERSSTLLHKYKLEVDTMRIMHNVKEKQIENRKHESLSDQDLQTKNIELFNENTKLKQDLSLLTTKHQTLVNEMQDARQYLMKIIENLD